MGYIVPTSIDLIVAEMCWPVKSAFAFLLTFLQILLINSYIKLNARTDTQSTDTGVSFSFNMIVLPKSHNLKHQFFYFDSHKVYYIIQFFRF